MSSGFACLECGHKFKTVRAAERASWKGCPQCGGTDVDIDTSELTPRQERFKQARQEAEEETVENLRCADDILRRLLGGVVVEVF